MIWSDLRDHVVQVVAGAALLGGGGFVVSNNIEVARHDERIKTIEAIPETLLEIQKAQALTNERLMAIETKLEK
jgi:hypothetical protein